MSVSSSSLDSKDRLATDALGGWEGEVTYGRLFRNTSLFGGVMGINMLINMIRLKVMAYWLGPSGVGVFWLYFSVLGFIQSFISLSISTSGVRELAECWGRGNAVRTGEMYRIIRRVLVILGMAGGIGLFFSAEYASLKVFNDDSQVTAFRCLSIIFVFSNLFIGQEALLQGVRRPGAAAKASVISNALGASYTIILLVMFGRDGIVPSLIIHPFISVIIGRWLSQDVPIVRTTSLPWQETWRRARGMLFLGTAITLSGSVYTWSALWIRTYLLHKSGEDEVGLYSFAFGITTYAIIFVASALSMEFFPRLSALRGKPALFSPLINKQVEVIVLLTAPLFLSVLIFSEWLLPLFSSDQFKVATGAFQWFVCGALIQLLMWPMGLIRYAHKWVKLTFFLEVLSCLMHIGLVVCFYPVWGLEGLGIAFFILRFYELLQNIILGRWLMGYAIDKNAGGIALVTIIIFIFSFLLLRISGTWSALPCLAFYLYYLWRQLGRIRSEGV